MDCIGAGDLGVIKQIEQLHWILYNSFLAIRKIAVAITQCERALKPTFYIFLQLR